MIFMKYDFEVVHMDGTQNIITDYLSRIPSPILDLNINKSFLDPYIYNIIVDITLPTNNLMHNIIKYLMTK